MSCRHNEKERSQGLGGLNYRKLVSYLRDLYRIKGSVPVFSLFFYGLRTGTVLLYRSVRTHSSPPLYVPRTYVRTRQKGINRRECPKRTLIPTRKHSTAADDQPHDETNHMGLLNLDTTVP